MDQISVDEPPPAPVADFIPQKPLPGNNFNPSPYLVLTRSDQEIRMPRAWPLSLMPVLGGNLAPLPQPEPSRVLPAEVCAGSRAQPYPYGFLARLPSLPLQPENPLPEFEQLTTEDPDPAGPLQFHPAAAGPPASLPAISGDSMARYTYPEIETPRLPLPRSLAFCGPLPGPQPEVVEAFLPLAPEPLATPFARAVAFPTLTLQADDWTIEAGIANSLDGPAAEPVERFLPVSVDLAAIPGVAMALPGLQIEPADWTIAVEINEAAASPAPEAVECFLTPSAAVVPIPYAPGILLPKLPMQASDWQLSADPADFVATPPAEAVENFLPPPPAPQSVPYLAAAATLPDAVPMAVDWTMVASLAEPAPGLVAEAVESWLPPAAVAQALAFPIHRATMLPWTVAAADPEVWQEDAIVGDPAESLPGLPASEVAREIVPSTVAARPATPTVNTPSLAAVAPDQPLVRWAGGWQVPAAAEPVFSYVTPRVQDPIPVNVPLALPSLRSVQMGTRTASARRAAFLAPAASEKLPGAVEPPLSEPPMRATEPAEDGERWARLLQFPGLAVQNTSGNRTADFRSAPPAAAEPKSGEPNAQPVLPPALPDAAAAAQAPAAAPNLGVPQEGPAAMEFFCQRMPASPICLLQWNSPLRKVHPPKFVVRPIFERTDEAAPPKPERKPPAFAEIFAITRAARKSNRKSGSGIGSAGKAIAASLLVGVGLWFGAGAVKISRQMVSINTSLPSFGGSGSSSSSSYETSSSSRPLRQSPGFGTASGAPASYAPHGPLASVRHAIQQRAAVELTDTFRRMEAWGSAAKALPAGWSRHPDGYVRTGQLALYHPSQTFADYRFEFFGGIEKKGMSWAVRARDSQNYYAMKFTVVEPGLRPMIAAVHYAVVGGRKTQRVETPLSVMVHNNEPYHVAVDVHGNKVTTSIEGQEVDTWTDDTLKSGGVGFFSELGESARLYWIRVTKNQDWLGRVCAYLSGGTETTTADLWRNDFPNEPSQPTQPYLPPNADVSLAAAETDAFSFMGPQRGRILKYGRTELCRS